jgi:hypothetical protein
MAKQKGEILISPLLFSPVDYCCLLLLIVQFDGVTGVYIFEREDNHG